jgi:hypothetical protein
MCLLRGYSSVKGKALDGVAEATFYISEQKIKNYQRNGPSWKFHGLLVLAEILKNPTVIFRDLKRDYLNSAFCYSGVPSHWYKKIGTDIDLPFPPNQVFVVYVEETQDQHLIILDWDKRKQDSRTPGHPVNWEQDFGVKLWPLT